MGKIEEGIVFTDSGAGSGQPDKMFRPDVRGKDAGANLEKEVDVLRMDGMKTITEKNNQFIKETNMAIVSICVLTMYHFVSLFARKNPDTVFLFDVHIDCTKKRNHSMNNNRQKRPSKVSCARAINQSIKRSILVKSTQSINQSINWLLHRYCGKKTNPNFIFFGTFENWESDMCGWNSKAANEVWWKKLVMEENGECKQTWELKNINHGISIGSAVVSVQKKTC